MTAADQGGTAEKPVGTVWRVLVGLTAMATHRLQLAFDRPQNKLCSAYHSLDILRYELMRI